MVAGSFRDLASSGAEVRVLPEGQHPDDVVYGRVQDGGELGLPGPAGGHPECPLAAGAGQAGGDLEEVAAAGAGGLDGLVGQADLGAPAAEVVREGGDHGPGAVGVHTGRRGSARGLGL